MRAVILTRPGGPEMLIEGRRPRPVAASGQALVRVRAFGLNHAEVYMRSGVWPVPAQILGIECVGEIADDPDGRFGIGRKVAALMGGMGRTIDGSYAELVRVPAANVVPLDTRLDWPALGAIPEVFATAWTCLHRNLALQAGGTLLVRGGTSALGQAAIALARDHGATVYATSRRSERLALVEALGATGLVDAPDLATEIRRRAPAGLDGVLDLVGTTTVLDSLRMVRRGGGVCLAGFLGGGGPVAIDPLANLPSGVLLSFFASTLFGSPGFALDDVPLQAIVDKVAAGALPAGPAHTFAFGELAAAHRLMESGEACGKIVVVTP